MKLIKDYDYTMANHLRKANVIADALSKKKKGDGAFLLRELKKALKQF